MKLRLDKRFNIIGKYSLIFLGIVIFSYIFYTRFILFRAPKEIPLLLTEPRFYILLYVCFIYLYVIKSLLFPKEQNIYLKYLTDIIFYPLQTFDTAWKTSYRVQPYYITLMSCLINYLESTSTNVKHILFIGFQLLPRIILLFIFITDIFYFRKLHYIYLFILLGILPLFYRYIKYSLKVYTDHLIIFAKQDYEYIRITNLIRLLYGQDPEATYDTKEVSIEEYIEIIYENMLHIRNFDLASYIEENELPPDTEYNDIPSNVRYDGGGIIKDDFAIKYAKRFFKKNIKIPVLDLNDIEYAALSNEFDLNYPKIFILKDLIPLNDEITNKPIYKYIRVVIFMTYFILWSYLLFISYHKIDNFLLTELLLKWLTFYIENTDPFSQITLHDTLALTYIA